MSGGRPLLCASCPPGRRGHHPALGRLPGTCCCPGIAGWPAPRRCRWPTVRTWPRRPGPGPPSTCRRRSYECGLTGRGRHQVRLRVRRRFRRCSRATSLGAWVCGPPAHDPDFGTADLFALLSMDRVHPRYLEFFLAARGSTPAACLAVHAALRDFSDAAGVRGPNGRAASNSSARIMCCDAAGLLRALDVRLTSTVDRFMPIAARWSWPMTCPGWTFRRCWRSSRCGCWPNARWRTRRLIGGMARRSGTTSSNVTTYVHCPGLLSPGSRTPYVRGVPFCLPGGNHLVWQGNGGVPAGRVPGRAGR